MNRDWYEKFDQAIRDVEILQAERDGFADQIVGFQEWIARLMPVIDAARALDRNWHVDSLRLHHAAAVLDAVRALDGSGESS